MGEAKRRGTQEQREISALAAMRAQFPATVTCNNCQADLSDITPMDVRGMSGMRLAGGAHCPACQNDTWVLDGTQDALSLFRQHMDAEHGAGAVSSGFAKR